MSHDEEKLHVREKEGGEGTGGIMEEDIRRALALRVVGGGGAAMAE